MDPVDMSNIMMENINYESTKIIQNLDLYIRQPRI